MRSILINVETLTKAAFAPFGDVITRLSMPGRHAPAVALRNLRKTAEPMLGVSRVTAALRPFLVRQVECHPLSSQSFIPMADARFIVVVAPSNADVPDWTQFRAFLAVPGQGVSYAPGIWHHPLLAIGGPADFATLIWRSDDDQDERFAPLATPFEVNVPSGQSASEAAE